MIRETKANAATMIARGIITKIDDDAPTQMVQVETLEGTLADDVEHFQPYGMSFHPPVESEAAVVAVAGAQDHLLALCATDRDVRPRNVKEGEGGLYALQGWRVFIDEDGNLFLGEKDATHPVPHGDSLRDAMKTYADAVTEAVGQIKYTGTGSVDPSTATLSLGKASIELLKNVNDALSTRTKVE